MKNIFKITLIVLILSTVSCDKVILDPNSTLEPEITGSAKNLAELLNGVQKRWSTDRSGVIYNITHISGLNTKELRLLNPGNLSESEILNGGNDVNGGNGILNSFWVNAMLSKREAQTVIDNAESATSDATEANTLKAYGLFYRALVNGTLIQYFEQIPLEIIENAPFKTKVEVLQSTIADLTEAKGYVDSGLSSISNMINSIDLKNSINALLARYNLMAGNYNEAITAANAVDLSTKSVWKYEDAIPNPLAFWFGSQNVTQAKDKKFGLPSSLLPDANDKRIDFYVNQPDPVNDASNFQVVGFWTSNTSDIPVYLPGEMLLIKAEAYARLDDLTNAVAELDKVLTKKATNDAFGIGADLPNYSGANTRSAILDEIYKNRRVELYLSGLGLEDSRRFDRPNTERNRNYYPYPNSERDNNTSTPSNPSS